MDAIRRWWVNNSSNLIVGLIVTIVGGLAVAWLLSNTADPTPSRSAPSPTPGSESQQPSPSPSAAAADSPTPIVSPTTSPSDEPVSGAEARVQFLADLEPVQGSLDSDAAKINGETYEHSLVEGFGGCAQESDVEYDLSRDYREFRAVVGVSDASESASVVSFQVFGDGQELSSSGPISLGQSQELVVDVQGVLRLKLSARYLEGNMGMCSYDGEWIWGDAAIAP